MAPLQTVARLVLFQDFEAYLLLVVTPRSQNGPEALLGARPHCYGLPWKTVEVLAETLKIEKRRPA